jgi:damage-control phosphatase, subfamily I
VKSYLDCIPCFIRQSLDSIRRVSNDESIHQEVLRSILDKTSKMDLNESPPSMAQFIHRLIRKKTGVTDPYREIKQYFNREILAMFDDLKSRIEQSSDPIETAVRLAIAGNIIDLGARNQVNQHIIQEAIDHALANQLAWDRQEFIEAIENAETILYLADNAGEIVFDWLLIEQLPIQKITVAVRGYPILNDVTLDDVKEIGLDKIVSVIDNGSDVPGTILSDCSENFVERFNQASMVISKGQGNYETLSNVDQDIFFMLKAKCPVIAGDIGCKVGDMVFQRSSSKFNPDQKEPCQIAS